MAGIFGLFDFSKEPKDPFVSEKERKGAPLLFHILMQNFWKLVELNIVFLLYCLPVVTIPAAYSAMMCVLRDMTNHKPFRLWIDFWMAFKRNFTQSLLWGLLVSLLIAAGYFGISYDAFERWDAYFILLGGLACTVVLILGLMCLYVPILIVSVKQPLIIIVQNAFRLALIALFRNLMLIAANLFITIVVFLLFPYSLIFVALLYFSITGLFICFVVWPVIMKYVIVEIRPS